MPHRLSEKKLRKIYKLREKGLSCRLISEQTGVHHETIRRYCYRKYKKKKKLSDSQIKKIYDLRKKGLSTRQIAKKVGCTNVCVARYIRDAVGQVKPKNKKGYSFLRQILHKARLNMLKCDIDEIEKNIELLEGDKVSSKIHHLLTGGMFMTKEDHIELLKFMIKQKEDQIAFREHQKIEYEEFLKKLGV